MAVGRKLVVEYNMLAASTLTADVSLKDYFSGVG